MTDRSHPRARVGTNPFATRLAALTALDAGEIDALCALMSEPRQVTPERLIAHEGDVPQRIHILLDGWAARLKMLPDGRRLCPTLIVPGDICDIDAIHIRRFDFGVIALTRSTVASIGLSALHALCDANPRIARALTWLGFVDNSLIQEAATSLGRRSASERAMHLLCELRERLAVVGQESDPGFDFPLTQERIGDVLGLTAVHVNRTLHQLRTAGLATVARRRCTSDDWPRLARHAGFSPGYLHLEGMRADAA